MDSKAEKIALLRYGLIATLVLERLPRGELIRRARELAKHDFDRVPMGSTRYPRLRTSRIIFRVRRRIDLAFIEGPRSS